MHLVKIIRISVSTIMVHASLHPSHCFSNDQQPTVPNTPHTKHCQFLPPIIRKQHLSIPSRELNPIEHPQNGIPVAPTAPKALQVNIVSKPFFLFLPTGRFTATATYQPPPSDPHQRIFCRILPRASVGLFRQLGYHTPVFVATVGRRVGR